MAKFDGAPRRDAFRSLSKDIGEEILSFLTIRDICNFRLSSKHTYRNYKMSYTKEHCQIVLGYLGEIYLAGGLESVSRVLLDDSRIDPGANYNWWISWASQHGHLDLVRFLCNDSRVDPSDNEDEAIRLASQAGHANVVELLLNDDDSRVDPLARDNEAICLASH